VKRESGEVKVAEDKANWPTNKYDVTMAKIQSDSAFRLNIVGGIVKVVLVSIICYTLVKIMSFPADKIKVLVEASRDSKWLGGSIVLNIIFLGSWLITFFDNKQLRRERK
jgi:hypothetical protein